MSIDLIKCLEDNSGCCCFSLTLEKDGSICLCLSEDEYFSSFTLTPDENGFEAAEKIESELYKWRKSTKIKPAVKDG